MSEITQKLNSSILILTKKSGFSFVNKSALRILGWSQQDLQKNYQNLAKLCPGLAALAKLIKAIIAGDYDTELVNESIHKRQELSISGQYYNCYFSKSNDDYILELSPIIYQDMNQSTHELKRPIQNIKTLVEVLIMGAKDDKDKCDEYLGKLNSEADRLGNLVQDMLSLSHLINGVVDLHKLDMNVYDLVEKQIELAAGRAKTKNIKLINKLAKNITIKADKKLLEHALANLIDNAIKYNKDNGLVEISCKDNKLVVRDTGLGINQEDQAKIFDQFYRIQDRVHIQGSGLGLTLVKNIIDLHGWTINVESELGSGTSFVINYQ